MKTRKTKTSSLAKPTAVQLSTSRAKDRYALRLFVAGATSRSHQAVLRVRELCETVLRDRVKLEVIDIYQQPGLARENQIVATPTLIIQLPLPVRRFIGNLTTITDLFSLLDMGDKGRLKL